jgi:hypothetical protein
MMGWLIEDRRRGIAFALAAFALALGIALLLRG